METKNEKKLKEFETLTVSETTHAKPIWLQPLALSFYLSSISPNYSFAMPSRVAQLPGIKVPLILPGQSTLFLLLLRNICPEVSRFLFDVYNSDVRVYYLIHMSIERVYNRCSNYSEIKYSHIYIYIYNI